MGICASCLGGDQPRDPVEQEQDEVESGPLLFSVPNGMHYGSFAEPQMAPHSRSSRARRENKALQRAAARASDGMATTPGTYPRHKPARDRKAQYQYLLTKVDSEETWSAGDASLSTDEEDDAPLQGAFTRIKAEPRMNLVGSFREAAAVMA